MFWQYPTFIVKFQSRPRQISQFRGHLEKRLVKNEKNRIVPNKCDICTLDIMVDVHWKNEANRWRSEICLIRSYADSLLKANWITKCKSYLEKQLYIMSWVYKNGEHMKMIGAHYFWQLTQACFQTIQQGSYSGKSLHAITWLTHHVCFTAHSMLTRRRS